MEKNKKRVGVYETRGFKTKEELVEAVEIRIEKIKKSFSADEKKTDKYKAYELFLNNYLEGVRNMSLPKLSDDDWTFAFGVSEYGGSVSIGRYEIINPMEVHIHETYRLKHFETRVLPSCEYAKLHGVSETTVRQWIRRGKLRRANKYGNTWRIPEFAKPRQGQYCNVLMGWNAILTHLLPEYSFLNDFDEVQIQQINKDEYKVWFANNKTGKYTIKTMNLRERERFEVMMIGNPFVELFDDEYIDIDQVEESWKVWH